MVIRCLDELNTVLLDVHKVSAPCNAYKGKWYILAFYPKGRQRIVECSTRDERDYVYNKLLMAIKHGNQYFDMTNVM